MWLSDTEMTDLMHDLVRVIQPRLANVPADDRKRRFFGAVFLSGAESDS